MIFFAKKLTCSQKTGRIFTGEKGIVTKAIKIPARGFGRD